MLRAAFLLAALGALALPGSAAAACRPQLGPRARRASAVSISAPHALTRPYALRSS